MQASYGAGPVGTGAHLIGYQSGRPAPQLVEAWLTVLFFPFVPMGRWRVAYVSEQRTDEPPRVATFDVQVRSRVPVMVILRRLALAVGILGATVAPIIFGVRTVGEPWATELLTSLLGWVPELLAGFGKLGRTLSKVLAGGIPVLGAAVELGTFLGGAVLPILVLMRLDEQTPRVSFRTVLGRRRDVGVRGNAA